MDVIRSAANPLVKLVRAAGGGRAEGLVLLEGDRLVDEAVRQGWSFEAILVAESRAARVDELAGTGAPLRLVADDLLSRISSLVSSPGIAALAHEPASRTLESVSVDESSLVVVIGGVQDPGNLGAIARTAEAAGAQAIVLLAGGCRPWSTKALRGSMGSLLRLPVLHGLDAPRVATWIREHGGRSVRAATRDGVPLAHFDWSGPIALWLTSETGELPGRDDAEDDFENVTIATAPQVESLNVAAAAAVLLFAAGRVGGGEG